MTPFTLHTAAHSSGELLEDRDHTPDVKLGFHNDGLLNAGNLEIPNHIVLYNLYISYRKPGKFKWIPIALWDKLNEHKKMKITENIKIKIQLTPSFHLDKNGAITKTDFNYLEIPISNFNKKGDIRFFLNGKALYDKDMYLVQKIQDSLEKNSVIISIDQKERRAFYLKNTAGFHARDVFEDPVENTDLTRVFLRSVDVHSEVYPSRPLNFSKKLIQSEYHEAGDTLN